MSDIALKQQIQNLKKHNARLVRIARDARNKLSAALDGTGLCLWQLDVPSGKLIIYNRRWGSMLGYQPKELSAHFDVWREHLHEDDRQRVLDAFYDHLHGKTPFYEALHRMQHKNGTVTWVLDRGRVTEWDANGSPLKVTGTHIDMTKEKQYEEQLSALANHDPLTGLANRHALLQHFDELKLSGPVCVAFIDLDDFKAVNDTFGHRSGDELLIQLSQRLRNACPEGTIVGRLGGDEFVLLLPFPLTSLLINSTAHTCLRAALTPFELDNGEASVGASIGIDEAQDDDDFINALKRADRAMYHIKHTGKNGAALGQTLISLSACAGA
ncbi:PAS domain S-box-containing protein/diguanylate cyclase (GGDEF) domain-containing protein [Kosakonia oryzendophytica]|uniref:PAS domain S-box-containing protein/diguanylate cyclase (GGDEF) domain-containing protein n=1 Tax=Kosakonia oryzendophytica TaxID=1005665 RepID=A0A1C4DTH5_9ENTR|nr:sensor domain-containing diguanylate cyclase [Kosakonia oryzendophytica]AMO47186.1 Diguanylate cyclase with PAS/PAC sensor [Enterobacter sp. FY-07]TDT56772.1 PAS domain S-box-containing protein/diguanylate cyclase (GGDEF)-like protein [Enterobacter sp. AG5470]WBT58926.1 sensor domain-containing diguanylate cyclase [Kosakonia oryzendophytica]SCC34704.1 PAS domain S-box-containing protein/diguanylate cyclase (GGDEF) domain-containing protein [Kosakonia oryzendophytica]